MVEILIVDACGIGAVDNCFVCYCIGGGGVASGGSSCGNMLCFAPEFRGHSVTDVA